MPEPALRASNLSKSFGGLVAVDRVNLDLFQTEVHAVIGPNGAGKTTLLAMLAGDLAPSSGTIELAGHDVTRQSVEARTRSGIGRTFQRSAVIPRFAALDMVRLAALNNAGLALLSSLSANKPATARARAALGRVGLAERESRLEIAAVLALEPKILLLDEPLAGLGADESRDVVALIEGLKRDCAIMLIEHDIDVVFALADRITVLDNGHMIACGAPAEVRASEAVQQAYLGLDQP